MPSTPAAKDPVVLSYAALRRVVGIVAISLPFLVTLPVLVLRHTYEHSISAYYYTGTRNIFVGCLCAISTFMLCTRGYDRRDERASFASAVFALGVAFFPTKPECNVSACLVASYRNTGAIHYGSAMALFLTLAYMCLRLFTIIPDNTTPTPRKLTRNKLYVVCGCVILVSIAILGIRAALIHFHKLTGGAFPTVMLFETTSLLAFGIAWLVKGETFLRDQPAHSTPTHTRTTDKVMPYF